MTVGVLRGHFDPRMLNPIEQSLDPDGDLKRDTEIARRWLAGKATTVSSDMAAETGGKKKPATRRR